MHFSPTNKRISRVFLLFARLCLVWGSPQATVVKRPAPFDGVAGAFAPSLVEVRGKIPQFFVFFLITGMTDRLVRLWPPIFIQYSTLDWFHLYALPTDICEIVAHTVKISEH